ncbi:hypothetical protein D7W81_22275 [Corallococcus aberystwythensis]|uniref:Uncharacterized protein n=1 Tax=Corallococcus aberystwythensis TaxID=2316722 RepID=A0A3A8Q2W8_9BACT|nr:hypothetical protein D7W81_22275 [Corallococcus aberystwythensis]
MHPHLAPSQHTGDSHAAPAVRTGRADLDALAGPSPRKPARHDRCSAHRRGIQPAGRRGSQTR